MGLKLAELEEGTAIRLQVSTKDNSMPFDAVIRKHIKNNIAFITLKTDEEKKLVFDGVQVDMECSQDGLVPFIWHNVKVVNYKTGYLMQVSADGARNNRRGFFRVGVSASAKILTTGKGTRQATLRDLSLSGFSVADRKKELRLGMGDELSIYFEDLGHSLNLIGKVVRIEEKDETLIYGLEICNLCKNLSSYLSVKQRRRR